MKFPRLSIAGLALSMIVVSACSSSGGSTASSTESAPAASVESSAAAAPEEAAAPVVIRFWDQTAGDKQVAMKTAIVEAFNAANPDVQVDFRPVTTEYRAVIRPAFTSGDPPEIFSQEGFNDLWVYINEGQVVDIQEWWDQPGNGDRFVSASVPSVTYSDNKIYGFPTEIYTTNQIFYNKKILADNGIDPESLKTWDDFLAAFATLKAAGVTPLAYGDKEGWPGSEWLYNFMAKTIGAKKIKQLAAQNCGYKWTDPDVVAAAQMYIDLQDKGYLMKGAAGETWEAANAVFLSGKAGFYSMGNWFVPILTESPNAADFGMITFPTVTGGKGSAGDVLVSTQGLSLSSSVDTPEKKAAALKFMDFFTKAEQQKASVEIGNISTIAAANDPSIQDPYNAKIFAEQVATSTESFPFLEHIVPLPVGEDALWNGGVAVLTGQKNAQTWMEAIQAAAEKTPPIYKLAEDCA